MEHEQERGRPRWRFRISTLMLLVVIIGLSLALVMERRRRQVSDEMARALAAQVDAERDLSVAQQVRYAEELARKVQAAEKGTGGDRR